MLFEKVRLIALRTIDDCGLGYFFALQPSGVIGSVVGAVIALLIYRATQNRHAVR